MFIVCVQTNFAASHQLSMINDARENLHCHNWIVKVAVSAEKLDKLGLAVEFDKLKVVLDNVVAPLKGAQLEHLNCFANINASTENVAKFIYETIESQLDSGVKLEYVEVTEKPGCSVRYLR